MKYITAKNYNIRVTFSVRFIDSRHTKQTLESSFIIKSNIELVFNSLSPLLEGPTSTINVW